MQDLVFVNTHPLAYDLHGVSRCSKLSEKLKIRVGSPQTLVSVVFVRGEVLGAMEVALTTRDCDAELTKDQSNTTTFF